MNSVSDEKIVDKIIKKVGGSSLIAILQELQFHYNYLPEQVLGLLSKKLEVPLSKNTSPLAPNYHLQHLLNYFHFLKKNP